MNSFEKRHHKNRLKLQENSAAPRESASNGSTWKNMWKKVTTLLPYMWPKVPSIYYVMHFRGEIENRNRRKNNEKNRF